MFAVLLKYFQYFTLFIELFVDFLCRRILHAHTLAHAHTHAHTYTRARPHAQIRNHMANT